MGTFEDQTKNMRIILKWILRKYVVRMWSIGQAPRADFCEDNNESLCFLTTGSFLNR